MRHVGATAALLKLLHLAEVSSMCLDRRLELGRNGAVQTTALHTRDGWRFHAAVVAHAVVTGRLVRVLVVAGARDVEVRVVQAADVNRLRDLLQGQVDVPLVLVKVVLQIVDAQADLVDDLVNLVGVSYRLARLGPLLLLRLVGLEYGHLPLLDLFERLLP